MTKCPLCHENESNIFYTELNKTYYQCSNCELIFLDRNQLCSSRAEKERYQLHNNSELSDGYKNFLYKIINPVLNLVPKEALGLDFGSGPYPMMGKLLKKEGIQVEEYDLYFKPMDFEDKHFDFIIACEVIEHFRDPKEQFDLIDSILNAKGYLFIQTSLYTKEIDFKSWHYRSDITHISFFTKRSIEFLARNYQYEIHSVNKSVIILNKVNS